MRYPKQYTVAEWNKFNQYVEKKIECTDDSCQQRNWLGRKTKHTHSFYIHSQEMMCRKYDIVLTDHHTKKEKAVIILKKVNLTNISRGITKMNNGIDSFNGMVDKISREMQPTTTPTKRTRKRKTSTTTNKAKRYTPRTQRRRNYDDKLDLEVIVYGKRQSNNNSRRKAFF